jgi:pyrimidine-specific ribonucleoside hydrolase
MDEKQWMENKGKIPIGGDFRHGLRKFLDELEKGKFEEYVVDKTDDFVTIHDGCPKSSLHLLVLPLERIDRLEVIQAYHLDLLKRMAIYIRRMMLKLSRLFPDCSFTHGVHAVPTCSQLHVHVMSQDFHSEHIKNAERFNSFQWPFLVSLDDIIEELEASKPDLKKKFRLTNIEGENQRAPICHHVGCGKTAKSFADFQKHLCSCPAPLPAGRIPSQWMNNEVVLESDDACELNATYGPGASAFPVETLERWKECWDEATRLGKARAWEDAVRPLSESVQLRPQWLKGHLNLARTLQKCGQLSEARQALCFGLDHFPEEHEFLQRREAVEEDLWKVELEKELQDLRNVAQIQYAQGQGKSARIRSNAIPFVFDMETRDPDDVLTLLFLGSHPLVDLRAVTITPGSEEQVRLVTWILDKMNLSRVRIGAQAWPTNAKAAAGMQGDFYKAFGRAAQAECKCEPADRVLQECCDESVTLLTGAPLHNLGAALQCNNFIVGRWVAQGGFAGEGVVPKKWQLAHLEGLTACSTTNFDGNSQAAEAALASSNIKEKVLVSKNVCHEALYDRESWHKALGDVIKQSGCPPGLQLMYRAMDNYLQNKSCKKLHDPLALATALDNSVCKLVEVDVTHQKNGWGSTLAPGSGIWISIQYDPEKFQAVLLSR